MLKSSQQKWGSTGSNDGQFSGTLGISGDPVGNLCLVDADNKSIQKFDGAGKFVEKFAFQ